LSSWRSLLTTDTNPSPTGKARCLLYDPAVARGVGRSETDRSRAVWSSVQSVASSLPPSLSLSLSLSLSVIAASYNNAFITVAMKCSESQAEVNRGVYLPGHTIRINATPYPQISVVELIAFYFSDVRSRQNRDQFTHAVVPELFVYSSG